MKITGTSKDLSNSFTASRPGTAIGELNIGKDQSGPLVLRDLDRFRMRARNAEHAVAEIFDQALDIHRDQRLVFDDEHVGRDFGSEFAASTFHQIADGRHVDVEHARGVDFTEAFERNQKKCLARARRDLRDAMLGRQFLCAGLGRSRSRSSNSRAW